MKTTYPDLLLKYQERTLTAFGRITERKIHHLRIQLGVENGATEITSGDGEIRFNWDINDIIQPDSQDYDDAQHVASILEFGEETVAIISDRE